MALINKMTLKGRFLSERGYMYYWKEGTKSNYYVMQNVHFVQLSFFPTAQVVFEKMREMLHFLPDPRPTLKVGGLCYFYA